MGDASKIPGNLVPIGAGTNDLKTVSAWMERAATQLEAVASRYISVDRLVKVGLLAVSRQPLLFECTRESFLLAMMEAAQIGLEPTGFAGEAYLIPRKNNNLQNRLRNESGIRDLVVRECNFQPGYRGLIKVMLRDPNIGHVEARAVYPGDIFEHELGLQPKLIHRPVQPSKRESEDLTAVYAITRFRDPQIDPHYEIMWREDVEHVRASSENPNGQYSPWQNHYEMMARKSVLRREAKLVPTTDTEAIALAEYDERVEMGERTSLGALNPQFRNLLSESTGALYADEVTTTRTDQVREAVRARAEQGGQPAPEEAAEPGEDQAVVLRLKGEYRRLLSAALTSPVPDQTVKQWEIARCGKALEHANERQIRELIEAVKEGKLPGQGEGGGTPDAGFFPQEEQDARPRGAQAEGH